MILVGGKPPAKKYKNVARSSDVISCASKTTISGCPIWTEDSVIPFSEAPEGKPPGIGQKSGTWCSQAKAKATCHTVTVEGQKVIRLGDATKQNYNNCAGKVMTNAEADAILAEADDEGSNAGAGADANAPESAETPPGTTAGGTTAGGGDEAGGKDGVESSKGLCPTDFMVEPLLMTLETETSAELSAADNQSAGRGAGTYTWTTASAKLSLGDAGKSAQGLTVTVRAGKEPNLEAERGELVEVKRTQPGCAPITKQVRIFIRKCMLFRLARPRIIAIATDTYLRPRTRFTDPRLPGGYSLRFGQDLFHSMGRVQPHGPSVGSTTTDLESKMRKLLTIFASKDTYGNALRLFNAFLAPNRAVSFWSHASLTAAAEAHPNIKSWVSLALNAPNSPERSGRTRIHQRLQNAGWNINAAVALTDLGVPAFDRGNKWFQTGDFNNGLGVMINGVQHAIVVAKDYHYNQCKREYYIKLEYVFYDVFGLDDDDLQEFGADGGFDSEAATGITAWWQLQHQHNYAPLITRIAFEREFTVPVP